MARFRYDALFTRTELVRRAHRAAQAVARSVVLLDVNRKKHEIDDLLRLLYEEWFPRILGASRKGMFACALEFTLFTEGVETENDVFTLRKLDIIDRIQSFFEETRFRVLKFERWVLERDRIGVVFYISWQ